MCRSTNIHGFNFNTDRNRLKINGIHVRLSLSRACEPLPEFLTLVFLPRINASFLEVNGLKIRSNAPAFVTLHRVVSGEKQGISGDVNYASRERVRIGEGVQFEVFWREDKILKGIFRNCDEDEWKLDCKCGLESKMAMEEVTTAEINVAAEGRGHALMSEKVEIVAKKRKVRNCCLEEIPEEREVEDEDDEMDDCDCCCGGDGDRRELDGGDGDVEMEGVSWAVDIGILVMSLGLGFLASKSLKVLRFL